MWENPSECKGLMTVSNDIDQQEPHTSITALNIFINTQPLDHTLNSNVLASHLLGNNIFCSMLIFSINLIFFQDYDQSAKSFHPDQAQHHVGLDLGPNFLQRSSLLFAKVPFI